VGIAGVEGNGQNELAEAIAGLRPDRGGRVLLDGQDVTRATTRHVLHGGLGFIPADRHRMGLVLEHSVSDNLVLSTFDRAPFAQWIIDSGRLGEFWSALPLIFALLVSIKMIAAVWIAIRLYQSRLLSDRVLVTGAALWTVAVLSLYGVLVWLLDTPHIPHYVLMLVAILAIPLARLSAAPLAQAWNRHR